MLQWSLLRDLPNPFSLLECLECQANLSSISFSGPAQPPSASIMVLGFPAEA